MTGHSWHALALLVLACANAEQQPASVFSSYASCVAWLNAGGSNPFGSRSSSSSSGTSSSSSSSGSGSCASLGPSLASDFNASYHLNLNVGDPFVDFQVISAETGNYSTVSALLNDTGMVLVVFGMVSDPYMHFSPQGGFTAE
jgi:hypothetical protein